jgi:hypothetical protein
MTKKNKGGRPAVDDLRYKEYVVSTRLDAAGHLRLEELKRRSGRSAAEVIRELVTNGTVREKMKRVHLDFMSQLKGIARNLNQLVRLTNAVGYRAAEQKTAPVISEIERFLRRIRDDR